MFWPALIGLGAVTLVTAVMLRWGHGLTVDEPYMANTARLPWSGLWAALPNDNIPFYYLVMKAWIALAGDSELALRLLSAMAYGVAVVLTGAAARTVAGPAAGISAAMLMLASDRVGLEHAATARPYAVLSMIAALAMVLSLRSLGVAQASLRRALVLTMTHAVGLFIHPVYVVIAAASAVSGLLAERRLRSVVVIAPVLAVVLYAATWGFMVRETMALQTTSWMKPPTAGDVQRAYLMIWGTGPGFMIAGAVLAVLVANRARTRAVLDDHASRWAIGVAIVAWILPVLVSLWKPIFEATRTPALLLPATCVAVAALLARCGGSLPALALALLSVAAGAGRVAAMPRSDPYPTRASLVTLVQRAECGDRIFAPGLAPNAVGYYLPRVSPASCFTVVPFPASMINWTGQLREPALFARLQEEARRDAEAAAASGRDAWLLRLSRGETQEASALAEAALRSTMRCGDPEPLRGAFFDSVIRCEARRQR